MPKRCFLQMLTGVHTLYSFFKLKDSIPFIHFRGRFTTSSVKLNCLWLLFLVLPRLQTCRQDCYISIKASSLWVTFRICLSQHFHLDIALAFCIILYYWMKSICNYPTGVMLKYKINLLLRIIMIARTQQNAIDGHYYIWLIKQLYN